jgi:renalase
MTDIGIVGAGAAAAAAAFVLDEGLPDADLTVLEKSGGLCGRAATRRHEDLTYDYGANYAKAADERVTNLLTERLDDTGLVDISEPVYTFDKDGDVSPGRESDEAKWSYEQGLTQIAKRLFARTDAEVQRRTRVEGLSRRDGRWTLEADDGETWGPFDAVLLNPPAPQTADLLRTADWDDPARERLLAAVDDVAFRTIWTAVLRYPFELDVPYYGLVNTDKKHPVGWISREECKAGHVPDGDTLLVVQANEAWSVENYDADPKANVAELAGYAAEVVGDERLADPVWSDHQGWRYALTEGEVEKEPVDAAKRAGLYCAGDWVAGDARVHAALADGLAVGEEMESGLSSE